MNSLFVKIILITVILTSSFCMADCPLDHFIIGVNQDGIADTDDDMKLFVDCRQKYRNSGQIEFSNWFYPLNKSIFYDYPYRLGEPGFDVFQNYNPNAGHTYDPNRCPAGQPDTDYRIIVECLSISQDLRAVHKDYPQFTIEHNGENFNHSFIHKLRGDAHIHMSYQAAHGQNLFWMTYRLYDELANPNNPDDPNHYQPSEPFTIVFNTEPLSGDLVIDGTLNQKDLAQLSYYWLRDKADKTNDYYERADTNRDGIVNLVDFALFAQNRLK